MSESNTEEVDEDNLQVVGGYPGRNNYDPTTADNTVAGSAPTSTLALIAATTTWSVNGVKIDNRLH